MLYFRAKYFSAKWNLLFFFGQVAPYQPFSIFFYNLQQTELSTNPMGLLFQVFRHYETVSKFSFFVFFLLNFQNCFQRVPPSFLIFCSKLNFQQTQWVSPFKFFGTMRLFQNSHFSFFFNFLNCLQRVPFLFLIFCYKLDCQQAHWVPLPFST